MLGPFICVSLRTLQQRIRKIERKTFVIVFELTHANRQTHSGTKYIFHLFLHFALFFFSLFFQCSHSRLVTYLAHIKDTNIQTVVYVFVSKQTSCNFTNCHWTKKIKKTEKTFFFQTYKIKSKFVDSILLVETIFFIK